ncbi:hypothetical protein EYF80_043956 [Liparis tanakae]|uniref:Uncharacterized protein n=1 Tax=Liparis tanakae TaxID=230148 RepID=A0A4Z2FXW6_9TELE|nr:hypothetical protein EYF80_043956 [Liparis tanakae]
MQCVSFSFMTGSWKRAFSPTSYCETSTNMYEPGHGDGERRGSQTKRNKSGSLCLQLCVLVPQRPAALSLQCNEEPPRLRAPAHECSTGTPQHPDPAARAGANANPRRDHAE